MTTVAALPETLSCPPKSSLCAPGECQFTDSWATSKLLQRWTVSPTSTVFRFSVPDETKSLSLSTCACLLAKADVDDETVIRPYTPISTNAQIGSFDLLVKDYGAMGKMSRHMHTLSVDDSIEFKHIKFNVKIQAPFPFKEIGMIVGGTGITPMIQALHAILDDDTNDVKVKMLYGSRIQDDILGIELLSEW